jgi:hypothetical protein
VLNHKTGIAYVQYDTMIPASFLFTETQNPQTLTLDVLFAAKVPEEKRVEVNIALAKLNDELINGDFRLDTNSGYVYFRQSVIVDKLNLDDKQFAQVIFNLERVGLDTAEVYAQTFESEFPA